MTARPLVSVFEANETHKLVVDEKNNVRLSSILNAHQ
jgi:hypothetical protein